MYKAETRRRKLELFCSLLNPPRWNRTPRTGELSPATEYRPIRRLLNQRSKDRSQESSIVWSSFQFRFQRTDPSSSQRGRKRRCFRGVVGPTVEQDRAIRPPPRHSSSQWGRAGVTCLPLPKIWPHRYFLPDYSPARWHALLPSPRFSHLNPSLSSFSGSPHLFASPLQIRWERAEYLLRTLLNNVFGRQNVFKLGENPLN